MAEFKVGDRVKVVGVDMEREDRPYVGKIGTIYRISGYPFPYHVDFGMENTHVFNPECLQKIENEREFKVGDRVKWTFKEYSGTGVIIKNDGSNYRPWYVKRDDTSGPLNYNLWLNTCEIALIDSVVSEYHGFSVGDVVAVRGSGFTGKIAEFGNASTPGGITVVVMNDRGERRGITTTDIEKAIVKRVFDVGDWVKITEQAPQTLSTAAVHIGKVDKVSEVIFYSGEWSYKVQLYFYPAKSLIAAQAPNGSKPESTRLKVGDRVRVVKDKCDDRFVGKTGVIEKDDQTKAPFLVRFDDGDVSIWNNGTRWFYVDELVKIEDVKPVENKIKIGDRVKIVGMDVEDDRQFVGRTGEVSEINTSKHYHIGVQIDGYGFRRFSEKCVEVVAEKMQEERKFKVGDRVKIVSDRACHTGEIGIIVEDDGSDRKPLKVERENGTHLWWCEPEWLEKVGEVKPMDDWRARFEAFKMSHPVGSKVRIARKVETDKHAMPWVPSMDGYIGETLQVVSYGYNKEGDRYTLSVGKFGGPDWNYPIDALEDVTETNQYTFNTKPSDVDLDRIWREANADFAVVVDYDKKSDMVWILYRSGVSFQVVHVEREYIQDAIKRRKAAYENEKKQRIVVTIY